MLHRRLIALAGSAVRPVALCALLGLLVSATHLAQTLTLARALAHLFPGGGGAGPAGAALAWAGGCVLLRAALLRVQAPLRAWCGTEIRARLRDQLVLQLGTLGPAHAAGARAGQAQHTLVTGVEALDAYYTRYLPQLLVVAVVPAAIVGWLATVHPPAALALGCALALGVVLPRFWDATLLRRGRERWAGWGRLGADYLEATGALPTLRVLGAGERVGRRLAARGDQLHRATMAQLRVSLVEHGISALAPHGGTAVTVAVVAAAATAGDLGAAGAFLFLLCGRECFRPLADLSAAWHAGYQGLTAVDGIEELFAATPSVPDDGTHAAPAGVPDVRFENVHFTHPGGAGHPALDGAALPCPAGALVGVVGASGAGKSTLAALLTRHHDPDAGSVLLAGRPLPEYRLAALRATVTVVHQDPYLFQGSVADNIRLARPEATDAQVRRAARLAGAHTFVHALPDGYATVLGERGSTLSGGQRQRVALARAFLSTAPVLVLDEATSHLDPGTEAEVLEALSTAPELAGRTRIVIAHRLAAVRRADLVAVLDGGRVVECDAPGTLLARPGGAYRALLDRQRGRATEREHAAGHAGERVAGTSAEARR
ncbi:ABC transporter ATP-binding protein/permease [Streptomyces triticirhizae]|uniref:ABC transporter ATP-binding protein n=1 Tax=Streptomyces triticirhizae TaxID=2483353 RepID=A0A3M2LWM0_9ACTN|nr:ABC transporter ATP-binding protein [Streptomyces triticirhizae]RMI41310.1 ABC transporter ATP-binding protein [Streptomyces triticirhizae]